MFLSRLALRNFRAFEGDVTIDFPHSRSSSRSVYLIGGENGAGKTSLLLALSLGLYGATSEGHVYSAGRRRKDQAYAWTLEESFNRAAFARGEDSMAVTATFDVYGDAFEIQREWWFEGGRFAEEDARLRMNGKPLSDAQYDMSSVAGRTDAVEQLMDVVLPARAARFFLFDGEEVASLADRDLGKSVIHGLDELLGLDQVHRVARQLSNIERAERERLQDNASIEDLEAAQGEFREAEETYNAAARALHESREEHLSAEATLESLQSELLALFQGRDVSGIAELREQLGELRAELSEVTRQVTALVNDGLALTPSLDLLAKVITASDQALLRRRQADVTEGVASALEEIVRKISTWRGIEPKLTTLQKRQLEARAAEEARSIREAAARDSSDLEEFSESELQRVRSRAATLAGGQALVDLQTLAMRRQELRRAVRTCEADLRTFEQSGLAGELLAKRPGVELAVERGLARVELTDGFAAEAERGLKDAHSRIAEVEKRLATTQLGAAKMAIARHARLGLERFAREMRSRRTAALEAAVEEILRGLLHRQGALSGVTIDADTGAVMLFDGEGHEIAVPSAGEKELFALSLIRALGRLSNRDAPMVIDTPLGRLDQAHRSAIVGKFLPSAASQVIVLATDSEVFGDLYATLRPHLAWQATLSPKVGGGVELRPNSYFLEAPL